MATTMATPDVDVETCECCGGPADVVGYGGAWCADEVPVWVQRELDGERAYEAWRDDDR